MSARNNRNVHFNPNTVYLSLMSSPTPAKPANDHDGDDPYFATMESLARVTVSGLGGFLVGLSLARRGSGGGAAARQAASAFSKIPRAGGGGNGGGRSTTSTFVAENGDRMAKGGKAPSKSGGEGGRRLRPQRVLRSTPPSTGPYVDHELPYTWAVAVMSFVGILEFTRATSPTSLIWDLTKSKINGNEAKGGGAIDNAPLDPSLKTISDFVVGGSLAGALFRGSAVRTRVGARIDASIMGAPASSAPSGYASAVRGRPLSGLLPGAALGLLAGIATVAADRTGVAAEEYFGQAGGENDPCETENAASTERESAKEDLIPADIRAMSNEELMKSIESLKRSGSASHEDGVEEARADRSPKDSSQTLMQSSGEGKAEATGITEKTKADDLLSLLGFRPHPSK